MRINGGIRVVKGEETKGRKRVFKYIKDCILYPEEHLEHWEDWLGEMRRNLMLLNIIYYIQQVRGLSEVTKGELEAFLEELYWIDKEIFFSIIKPWKPLDSTLEELLERGFITKMSEKSYAVNREKIKTEEDLAYWKSIRHIFDMVEIRQQKKFEVLATIYCMQKDLGMEYGVALEDIDFIFFELLNVDFDKEVSRFYHRKLLHSILEEFLELDYISRTSHGKYIVNEEKLPREEIREAIDKVKTKVMEVKRWLG